MAPRMEDGIFVFATVAGGTAPSHAAPLMIFREAEGLTLILREDEARRAGIAGTFRCRMITLTVHSSLAAVGFLAAVTRRLADAGIAVNPVSAFHHDHLFVPVDRADEAMALLRAVAAG